MRIALFVFALLSVFVVVNADIDLNQIFHITVVGSFRQDIAGFPCDQCDCNTNGCSTWVDSNTCFGQTDDNEQRWGTPVDPNSPSCACFCQSGIGFQGITNVQVQANAANSTRIGMMRHYNNVITGTSPTHLQLYINMSAPELTKDFQTIFPLSFIETPNNNKQASSCDPSIQRTDLGCDDRFSFDSYTITNAFVSNNVRYTLQITGFIQAGGTEPIAQFVTKEGTVTSANVYAKIITFCVPTDCAVNEEFQTAPVCACQCVLTNKTCNAVFNPKIAVNEQNCDCECASDGSECNATDPTIGAFNNETCSCGCNYTNEYCKGVNPLFEVSLEPGVCACACNRQAFIDCRAQNLFFTPLGADCLCQCTITDKLCKEFFGNKYRANHKKCVCFVPGGSSGLTDGEIAGIVVATVVGPLLIIGFIILLAALLAYLILAGYIPGIYGYKIAQGSFAAGGNSGLYADPWTNNSNAAAG